MEYLAHVAADDFAPGQFATLAYAAWVSGEPKPHPVTGDTVRPSFLKIGLGDVWQVVAHTETTADLVNGGDAVRLVRTHLLSGITVPGPTSNWLVTDMLAVTD